MKLNWVWWVWASCRNLFKCENLISGRIKYLRDLIFKKIFKYFGCSNSLIKKKVVYTKVLCGLCKEELWQLLFVEGIYSRHDMTFHGSLGGWVNKVVSSVQWTVGVVKEICFVMLVGQLIWVFKGLHPGEQIGNRSGCLLCGVRNGQYPEFSSDSTWVELLEPNKFVACSDISIKNEVDSKKLVTLNFDSPLEFAASFRDLWWVLCTWSAEI